MDLIIFAGPSLGVPDPTLAERIDFRGPAARGDIARAALEQPTAIGLIDGVLETSASVWHKEIIFALAKGIAVFGASSMGAIRAVELAPFGMVGIGEVFRTYRNGVSEDDDEIVLQHGPAEVGFVSLSEAMVNIRATLRSATVAGIVTVAEAKTLCRVAKALFYKDRTWERIVASAKDVGMSRSLLDDLIAWVPANSVDVKRQDAEELVRTMLEWIPNSKRSQSRPVLSHTVYWDLLCRHINIEVLNSI
jgi:hypothetical protein